MQPSVDPLVTPLSTELVEKLSRCALYDQNDTGNAKRLMEHFGEEFLHVREVGFTPSNAPTGTSLVVRK